MLTGTAYTAMVPVRDVERARDFYENTLGLTGRGATMDGGHPRVHGVASPPARAIAAAMPSRRSSRPKS